MLHVLIEMIDVDEKIREKFARLSFENVFGVGGDFRNSLATWHSL
jgi:hypothetical protein